MHPDAMIAALKAELAEARDDNHRRQIEGEIKRIDALDRPVALPETPDLVHDQGAVYLDALRVELADAVDDGHRKQIEGEIRRVEKDRAAAGDPVESDPAPSASKAPAPTPTKAEKAVTAPAAGAAKE